MTHDELLTKLTPPGRHRSNAPRGGVIQIHLTRGCDKACNHCTQGSNLKGKVDFITVENFELACGSLVGYNGVIGLFGGNPALHPAFGEICRIFRMYFPNKQQRGLWCNHPKGRGAIMRETFNPHVSNLNVHLDQAAYEEFKRDWPECNPFGHDRDSDHAPVYLEMDQVIGSEEARNELIASCKVNKYWSAMVAQFRGELRAWFCEIAGGQSILNQWNPDYPDTGLRITSAGDKWWQLPMTAFSEQVTHHCHKCAVPLELAGVPACDKEAAEITSSGYFDIYRPKKANPEVNLYNTELVQLEVGGKGKDFTTYY